jgi:glycosyltransferase involved in cell wall biosynthesis
MKVALLNHDESLGGGATYLRELTAALATTCTFKTFLSSRGECAADVVNAWQGDIIHVNHLRALLQLFKFPWSHPKAPVVFVVHGIHLRKFDFLPRTWANRFKRFARLRLERALYKKCAALIALTESDRETIHQLYGAHLNVVTIPNGLSPTTPAPIPTDYFFICIGRFCLPKGQDVLLEAIARVQEQLRKENRRTLFIGDGETLAAAKAFARAHHIEDLVTFAGAVEKAAALLPRGRILIAPSRWEGLPFLLLEAGAQQKLVLASNCPGNRDIITDGETGFLFPPEDSTALAALLTRDYPLEEEQSIGAALSQKVARDFTVDQMAKKTCELWTHLAKCNCQRSK